MLVNFKQIIGMAEEGGYCIPAFNVYLGFCKSVLQQTMSVGKSTPPCYVFSTTTE